MAALRCTHTVLAGLVFLVVFLLFFSPTLRAEPLRPMQNLSGDRVLIPLSAPERERLVLVSFFTITAEEKLIGATAVYDDPETEAQPDYLEFYDGAGDLLSIQWVDEFGIDRNAVDRGLLEGEQARGLEGILVSILVGDAT